MTVPGRKVALKKDIMIEIGKLSLGLIFPIEAYPGAIPLMENQLQLAQQAEKAGFHSLWVRDVPLFDPAFGDAGQMFDPWVYISYIAAHTQKIKIGTASAILPLVHPLQFAKSTASIDVLFPDRLHLGVASGDRPVEYPAFKVSFEDRGRLFRESLETIKTIWKDSFPNFKNSLGSLNGNADILPKPNKNHIPLYVTGYAGGQDLEWIAAHADGWMSYPRNIEITRQFISRWEAALEDQQQPRKPYLQSLYIDLVENPGATPTPIHLGFRLGRNYLLELLKSLESTGVNHVILVTKFASRPLTEIIDELEKEILPQFK